MIKTAWLVLLLGCTAQAWVSERLLIHDRRRICGDASVLSASLTSNSEKSPSPQSLSTSSASKSAAFSLSWDYKKVVEDVFKDSDKPILLFDGICNFCNGGVNLCLDLDTGAKFRYASLQSKVGQSLLVNFGKAPNDVSSLVLVQSPDKAYFHSDAVLRVGEALQGFSPVLRFGASAGRKVMPKFVRDGLYKVVAKNRYLWGEADGPNCRLDLDGEFTSRFVQDPDEDFSI